MTGNLAVRQTEKNDERIMLVVHERRSSHDIGFNEPKVELIYDRRRRYIGLENFNKLTCRLERVFGKRTNIPGLVHLGDRRKGGITDRFHIGDFLDAVKDDGLRAQFSDAAINIFGQATNPGRKKVIYI